MSATVVRKKNQTTLPAEVLAQAGIRPKDQVDWRFENGEIRGRKLVPETNGASSLALVKKNGRHFLSKKLSREDIVSRIRADREGK